MTTILLLSLYQRYAAVKLCIVIGLASTILKMGSVLLWIIGSGRRLKQFFERFLYMVKHGHGQLVLLKKYTKAWLDQKTSDLNFAWEAHNGSVSCSLHSGENGLNL